MQVKQRSLARRAEMKQLRVSGIKLSVCLFTFLIFFLSFQALAQKAGVAYFGDADGNAIIEVPDLIALNTVLGDFSADDTLIYTGYPQSRYRQDLDGNDIIEVPDLILLNSWIPGDFSNRPGNPDRLLLDGSTHLNLNLGDTITLSAYALSPVSAGSQVRTGFGVIFKIDPSSTCTTAKIYGYDVAGGATINAWRSNSAYHYTLKPDAPENGRASVRVNTNGCNSGQTIKVDVYIPDDSEAGVFPGRFPSKLEANLEFQVKAIIDSWTATSTTNAPSARAGHTAVWTGTEMIVWGGGYEEGGDTFVFNSGGRYNPVTDSWSQTSTTNAPGARDSHTAVWTGNEMIVWGGKYVSAFFNTGGRYNPATDSWTATSIFPTNRWYHTAVWTGIEMIIWGGCVTNYCQIPTNTGSRYNPVTNSWNSTTLTNAPYIRTNHTAVWTGTEMIVWGGVYNYESLLNTGGRYNPGTNSWTATTTSNAPEKRSGHTAVWTGTRMIVWGGYYTNTGGLYDPSTNSWTSTTTTNAPSIREYYTAVWTGIEMIIWGGYHYAGPGHNYNTGGIYDPSTDSWIETSTTDSPSARSSHTAIWTGIDMIVWGGVDVFSYFDTAGRYVP